MHLEAVKLNQRMPDDASFAAIKASGECLHDCTRCGHLITFEAKGCVKQLQTFSSSSSNTFLYALQPPGKKSFYTMLSSAMKALSKRKTLADTTVD